METDLDDYCLRAFDRLFSKTVEFENGCIEFTGYCVPMDMETFASKEST